jgi:hypothetical protein
MGDPVTPFAYCKSRHRGAKGVDNREYSPAILRVKGLKHKKRTNVQNVKCFYFGTELCWVPCLGLVQVINIKSWVCKAEAGWDVFVEEEHYS